MKIYADRQNKYLAKAFPKEEGAEFTRQMRFKTEIKILRKMRRILNIVQLQIKPYWILRSLPKDR